LKKCPLAVFLKRSEDDLKIDYHNLIKINFTKRQNEKERKKEK